MILNGRGGGAATAVCVICDGMGVACDGYIDCDRIKHRARGFIFYGKCQGSGAGFVSSYGKRKLVVVVPFTPGGADIVVAFCFSQQSRTAVIAACPYVDRRRFGAAESQGN